MRTTPPRPDGGHPPGTEVFAVGRLLEQIRLKRARYLCSLGLVPLDAPVEYILCSYPAHEEVRVVEAGTGLEVWFHINPNAQRVGPGFVIKDPDDIDVFLRGDLGQSVRFEVHPEVWFDCFYFALLALASDAVRHVRLRAYFQEYGILDNDGPEQDPPKTLRHLLEYAA